MSDLFSMEVDLSNIDGVVEGLRACSRELMEALTEAMVENVNDLLGRGMELAPIKTGHLRGTGSARVNGPTINKIVRSKDPVTGKAMIDSSGLPVQEMKSVGDGPGIGMIDINGGYIQGQVAFTAPYAAVQHENLAYRHPRGGQAKYLEKPLKDNSLAYADNMARHAEKVLKKP